MKQLFTSLEGKNNLKNELSDIFHKCEYQVPQMHDYI